jgi:hypothetical protein
MLDVSVELDVAVAVEVTRLAAGTYGSSSSDDELPQALRLMAVTTARAANTAGRMVGVGSTAAKVLLAITPGYREDP